MKLGPIDIQWRNARLAESQVNVPMEGSRASAETLPAGLPGTPIFSGFLEDFGEYNPQLEGLTAIRTYEKMRRSDAQVAATLLACELPIRAANWDVLPASSDALDREIAQFVKDNLFGGLEYVSPAGVKTTQCWDDVLRNTLLMLPFPCGTITANAQLFNGSANDIKFIGCGSGRPGSGADITPAQTTLIKAGASYPAATDMIYIASQSRSTYDGAKLAGEEIKNVDFDMNSNTGNAFHFVTADYSVIDGVKVWNCVNCGEIDGGLSSDTNSYASYHTTIRNSQFQPLAGSTGYGLWFNAQYGEITYTDIINSRTSGNITNGGGLSEILFQAGSTAAHSITNVNIRNSYIGNPVCQSGSYGIRFEAPGDYLAATSGRILNVNIKDSLIERLFSCSNGYPMGGTSGGSASATGLGSFHLNNVSSGSNWAANLLNVDLGSGTVRTVGDETGPLNSSPLFWVGGSQQGTNSYGILLSNKPNATANNDTLYGLYVNPTFTDGSYTGVSHVVADFTTPSASGSVNLGPNVHFSYSGQPTDGSCTMSSATSCTSTVTAGSYCVATVQGSSPIASACQISGTTLTVTAASSNSDTWAWHITD